MTIIRVIFVFFAVVNLTGCLTIGLSKTIDDSKYSTSELLSETVTDIYISNDSSRKIQLGGVNGSFLVFDDNEGLKALLSSSLMNVDDLSLKQDGEFSLFEKKNYTETNGKIDFIYSFKDIANEKGEDFFKSVKCERNAQGECVFKIVYPSYFNNEKIVEITGQKKIHLQKPLFLNMKKYKEHTPLGSYALMLLYPFAIIIDAVTFPVQIFFIPFGMGG